MLELFRHWKKTKHNFPRVFAPQLTHLPTWLAKKIKIASVICKYIYINPAKGYRVLPGLSTHSNSLWSFFFKYFISSSCCCQAKCRFYPGQNLYIRKLFLCTWARQSLSRDQGLGESQTTAAAAATTTATATAAYYYIYYYFVIQTKWYKCVTFYQFTHTAGQSLAKAKLPVRWCHTGNNSNNNRQQQQ